MAASNESIIYGYLDGLGLTPAGDAALLGNLQEESGFRPTAYNSREGAVGLAQWELGRRTALDQYAAAHGEQETDLAAQLGYLGQELAGPFSGVLSYLRSATDPSSAAAYVDANFERSSGSTRSARVANAQTIYEQITTGKLTASSSPTTPPGSGSGAGGATFGGIGSDTGGSAPPYDPSTLDASTLTSAQRSAIVAWLTAQRALGAISGIPGNLTKLSDAGLLDVYKVTYEVWKITHAGITGPGDPLSSLSKTIVAYALKGGVSIGGLALVVLGFYTAARPGRAAE